MDNREQKLKEFDEMVRPVVKYLKENGTQYQRITIDNCGARWDERLTHVIAEIEYEQCENCQEWHPADNMISDDNNILICPACYKELIQNPDFQKSCGRLEP